MDLGVWPRQCIGVLSFFKSPPHLILIHSLGWMKLEPQMLEARACWSESNSHQVADFSNGPLLDLELLYCLGLREQFFFAIGRKSPAEINPLESN